ncbi:SLAC1 anion channel family protein [Pseudoduganella umbonata]|uniref:C4-dicarboxylate ABC transporter n=1 Tax=Pseudoduganella umbonata TaxID=864828 RepID=A0A4P8HQ47_9BURK|nr:SLAC1 anion channel family protein [Pseudoduganella umbonata]MBB3221291.1 tellurite resistance protein [Pseudoduganella umbonata]QCP10465.1 C4-dicarboxylate ABC transporter [Pseudoduganella umbonata]
MTTSTGAQLAPSTAAAGGSSVTALPVALFGAVMGLAGLALAWRSAHAQLGAPAWIGIGLGWLAMLAFVAVTAAYGIKALTAFGAVQAEFNHPVAGNMFGTPLISVLLLPMLLADASLPLARALWAAGAVGMTVFAWFIVSRWMRGAQEPVHATPAWIVPVVGMLDVPLALPALHWPGLHGVAMFALGVGLFFALPLLTLILSRLMFQEPMPEPLRPSLMIMVAPFAVGFSSYASTTGRVDEFATALYMLMLFMLAVLLGRLRNLPRCSPFRVSWWAVSFPLAASATATLRYAGHAQDVYTNGIAMLMLGIATVVIAGLLLRTLAEIARGELRTLIG